MITTQHSTGISGLDFSDRRFWGTVRLLNFSQSSKLAVPAVWSTPTNRDSDRVRTTATKHPSIIGVPGRDLGLEADVHPPMHMWLASKMFCVRLCYLSAVTEIGQTELNESDWVLWLTQHRTVRISLAQLVDSWVFTSIQVQ